MSELATLRTAKAAMDEGLIAPEDFDTIKLAFLRAQQIKAGLDAGFIREEDYAKTKDAFLHALDFRVLHVVSPLPALANGAVQAPKAAAPAPAQARAAAPAPAAAAPAPRPAVAAAPAAKPPAAKVDSPRQSPSASVAAARGGPAFSAIPTDLPKTGRTAAAVGKVRPDRRTRLQPARPSGR